MNTEESLIGRVTDSLWKMPFGIDYVDENYLRRKYGNKVINRYYRLAEKCILEDHTKEDHQELMDYVYKTGLSDDIDPPTTLRSRETFKILFNYLARENEYFTLLDLGSGDGKIGIGLAARLENLERLYAVDISPFAIERMRKNIGLLGEEDQERVRRKLVDIRADYRPVGFQASMLAMEPKGIPIIMAAHVNDNDDVYPVFREMSGKGGKLVICDQRAIPEQVEETDIAEINRGTCIYDNQFRTQGQEHGVDIKMAAHMEVFPIRIMLLLFVGRKAEGPE
ncbi:MAG: methyltransferase domain-containing protein [Candidatus Aenigmarchaeota archaeon]|nr:methyltransferase domain-containing protein [Candidatus Aenigmarchaeota archaeon]